MQEALSNNFGSPTSFISHFSSYAMGMFGTGYVWLVMDSVDNLAVVGTYGAGTVLVQGTVLPQKARELDALAGAVDPQSTVQSASPGGATSAGQIRSYHSSAIIKAVGDFPGRAPSSYFNGENYIKGEIGRSPAASAAEGRSNQERFKSIHPLLCLSLHPHVYIPDYGVWGKEEYIRNFWGNVDWKLVFQRYQKVQELRK
jgi:Fe-Mn family superoxide dismutase